MKARFLPSFLCRNLIGARRVVWKDTMLIKVG